MADPRPVPDLGNPPRIVKPRRPGTRPWPIVAVGRTWIYAECSPGTGRPGMFARDRFATLLDPTLDRPMPPSIVACANPEPLADELADRYGDDPMFNVRLSIIEQTTMVNGEPRRRPYSIVTYMGWRRPNGHQAGRFFHPLSPKVFADLSLAELYDEERLPDWRILFRFARQVRIWCQRHQLRVSPTRGGLAAQLLRDPRFYPEPRRKVPTATNERARPQLPGGYFERTAATMTPGGPRIVPAAIELDQRNAHHHAARTVELPDANSLLARGWFKSKPYRVWLRPHERGFRRLIERHRGLIRCRIRVPHHRHGLVQPWATPGEHDAWLFTNELSELDRYGARIESVCAAWTSERRDTGLARFAAWSEREIDKIGAAFPWLKSVLLTGYGMLGARPQHRHSADLRASSGEPRQLYLGDTLRTMLTHRTERAHQSATANVIHRGMIEAETRRRSIELAHQLDAAGVEVLGIYADALIVTDGTPLPLLPEPWRMKRRLTNLVYETDQAYRSDQVRKLPGVPKRSTKRGDPASRAGQVASRSDASMCPNEVRTPSSFEPGGTDDRGPREPVKGPADPVGAGHRSPPGGGNRGPLGSGPGRIARPLQDHSSTPRGTGRGLDPEEGLNGHVGKAGRLYDHTGRVDRDGRAVRPGDDPPGRNHPDQRAERTADQVGGSPAGRSGLDHRGHDTGLRDREPGREGGTGRPPGRGPEGAVRHPVREQGDRAPPGQEAVRRGREQRIRRLGLNPYDE